MTHDRHVRTRRLARLGLASSMLTVACAAAPGAAQDAPTPPERTPERATEQSPEELATRLRERLDQVDAIRDQLASAINQLETGADPDELFTPDERRRMFRMLRGPGRGAGGEGWTGLFDRPMPGRPETGPGGPGDGPPSGLRERGPDRARPGPASPMTDAQLETIREIIDRHVPLLAERLAAAEKETPAAAARFLERIAPRFRDILDLRERAPELVEVRIDEIRTGMEIVAAARDLRRLRGEDAGSAAIDAKTQEIRALLVRQFELRQTLERDRIGRQLAELESARARLDEQAERRDSVVDDHLERVMARSMGSPRGEDGERERRRRRDDDRPRD